MEIGYLLLKTIGKKTNITELDNTQLKCDCIYGSILDTMRETMFGINVR